MILIRFRRQQEFLCVILQPLKVCVPLDML